MNLSRSLSAIALATSLVASASAIPAFAANTYASAAQIGVSNAAKDRAPASETLKDGLRALDRRNMAGALAARAQLRAGSLERKVLAWNIALLGGGADAATLSAIAADLPHWPAADAIRRNVERALVKETSGEALRVAFSQAIPETVDAALPLARAHTRAGDDKAARRVIAPFWTGDVLSRSEEANILAQVGEVLTRDDHRNRVEYLLSRDRITGAERIAGKAGMTSLVAARAAVERDRSDAQARLNAVPSSQKGTANYALSNARYLRKRERVSQASAALQGVDPDDIPAASRDEFWTESRIVASLLLSFDKPDRAYRTVRRNVAGSATKQMDADFFAGWIALRKLGDANTAAGHFKALVAKAGTPISKSRGHYWLGRALAKAGSKVAADKSYGQAARYDSSYYGQLAAQELGLTKLTISRPDVSAADRSTFDDYELVQAIAKMESAGHFNRAKPVYRHLARHLNEPGKLALLAARAENNGDFQLSLQVGKIAFQRGFEVDTLAWPIGAISTGTNVGKSDLALAYAIARQESTFQIDARSHADALGLMQLLPATAKRTAQSLGLSYSRNKLVQDGAYNARLGTAFLAQQMERFGGSPVLTFAAYNAGPGKSVDWIERNGDPRGAPLYEAIDWVEEIPYGETRNYVMRVSENLQIYRARLQGGNLTLGQELRAGKR